MAAEKLIRAPGMAPSRQVPRSGTVALEVVAHPRCGKRGLKTFGHHFTAEPVTLAISELDPSIVKRICAHGDLRYKEFDDSGKCLTPERKAPVPPDKKKAAAALIAKKKAKAPVPSPAGTAAKKARGVKDKPPQTSNHPEPAKPLPGMPESKPPADKPIRSRRRRGGADE